MRRTGKRTVKGSLGDDLDLHAGSCAEKTGPLRTESSTATNGAPCPPGGPEMVAS